jgi:Xaa-Pro aminopeptidase
MKKTALLLFGTGETCADLLYAGGFSAPDPVFMLVHGREKVLVVSPLEEGRARAVAKRGVSVITPDELVAGGPHRKRPREEWIAALLRTRKIRTVAVPAGFPIGMARELERRGIRVQVAKRRIFDRRVKSSGEVRRIAGVQRASVTAMRAAIALIRKSTVDAQGYLKCGGKRLTSEAVRERIAHVLLAYGCGGPSPIVAGGRSAADPHDIGHGPLRGGETIVIDIFPRHIDHGYWGDITRTVVKGKPSRRAQAMYEAVMEAQKTALRMIKAGARAGAIHKAAQAVFIRRGFKTEKTRGRRIGFFHGTGHGVGLEIHEEPSLSDNTGRLRKGHVVTVEPGLYYPESGGVRIEDTVLVTRRGWRYLATCGKAFRV